jgi:hypothetical protein
MQNKAVLKGRWSQILDHVIVRAPLDDRYTHCCPGDHVPHNKGMAGGHRSNAIRLVAVKQQTVTPCLLCLPRHSSIPSRHCERTTQPLICNVADDAEFTLWHPGDPKIDSSDDFRRASTTSVNLWPGVLVIVSFRASRRSDKCQKKKKLVYSRYRHAHNLPTW